MKVDVCLCVKIRGAKSKSCRIVASAAPITSANQQKCLRLHGTYVTPTGVWFQWCTVQKFKYPMA
jgi:hypothetical protein